MVKAGVNAIKVPVGMTPLRVVETLDELASNVVFEDFAPVFGAPNHMVLDLVHTVAELANSHANTLARDNAPAKAFIPVLAWQTLHAFALAGSHGVSS